MNKFYKLNIILSIFLLLDLSSKATVFNNTSAITIVDNAPASIYPSPITVSGMSGTITSLTVRINNLSHDWVSDVSIILQSPTGEALLLQSLAADGNSISNSTYTFSDAGLTQLSSFSLWANNGIYKPTSYTWDMFPAPAPLTPPGFGTYNAPGPFGTQTATLASTFNGVAPNGQWKLFVADFASGEGGSISGGWTLDVTTAVTMPLTLIDINVEKVNDWALLKWITSNEENVDYFNIEKSVNNNIFSNVKTVKAKGVNSEKVNYASNILLTENAINYFRLKIIDNDLKYQYSDVLTIDNRITNNSTKIIPNVIENSFIINSHEMIMNVKIYDINGNIVFNTSPFLKSLTLNKTSVNIARGNYFIAIETEIATFTHKIIVL